MSETTNVAAVRQYFKAFYDADDAAMGRLMDPGFVAHVPGGRTVTAAEWTDGADGPGRGAGRPDRDRGRRGRR